MAGALRVISVQRGHDPREFALVAFGGAGPLHANAVAELMGSFPVIVPPSPGLLCALGDLVADFRSEFARTLIRLTRDTTAADVEAICAELEARARAWMDAESIAAPSSSRSASWPTCATHGQGYEIPVPLERDLAVLEERFNALHEQLYGFRMPDTASEIVNLRAIGVARASVARAAAGPSPTAPTPPDAIVEPGERPIYDRGRAAARPPLQRPGDRDRVRLDHRRPARLRGRGRRPLQPPDPAGGARMSTAELRIAEIPDIEVDPITLDIIENALRHARFEMDAVLFRSAMSPVIREQHDEFPMLTDPQGRMVVGQFGAYISEMMRDWDRGVYPGDVILTSDPYKCSASISHTNDWLVLVPIFFEDELVGWASQFGHQMDAGGRLPGLAADGRDDGVRGGPDHPADQARRARRGAGGRAAADPQQRPPARDEPGRPVRDRRRLPRGREARDRALRALRQGRLPRRAAGAARPHARGDEDADRARDPGAAADVRGLDRRRRPRQRAVQDEADDLARGGPRLVRLVGHRPAGPRPDQLLPLRGHVQDVHRGLPDHGQRPRRSSSTTASIRCCTS